jgi:hypothetical protein
LSRKYTPQRGREREIKRDYIPENVDERRRNKKTPSFEV